MLQLHLSQVHLQLFGNQHRDGGIGALAHLDVRHREYNGTIRSDADEGVGRETIGRFGIAVCEWKAETQQQTSAGDRSGLQEPATGETAR